MSCAPCLLMRVRLQLGQKIIVVTLRLVTSYYILGSVHHTTSPCQEMRLPLQSGDSDILLFQQQQQRVVARQWWLGAVAEQLFVYEL